MKNTSSIRTLVQLNKGEEVLGLREFLFFDNKGQIRKQQPDDLVNLAGCLNLVLNDETHRRKDHHRFERIQQCHLPRCQAGEYAA